jgi:hypothetical protein
MSGESVGEDGLPAVTAAFLEEARRDYERRSADRDWWLSLYRGGGGTEELRLQALRGDRIAEAQLIGVTAADDRFYATIMASVAGRSNAHRHPTLYPLIHDAMDPRLGQPLPPHPHSHPHPPPHVEHPPPPPPQQQPPNVERRLFGQGAPSSASAFADAGGEDYADDPFYMAGYRVYQQQQQQQQQQQHQMMLGSGMGGVDGFGGMSAENLAVLEQIRARDREDNRRRTQQQQKQKQQHQTFGGGGEEDDETFSWRPAPGEFEEQRQPRKLRYFEQGYEAQKKRLQRAAAKAAKAAATPNTAAAQLEKEKEKAETRRENRGDRSKEYAARNAARAAEANAKLITLAQVQPELDKAKAAQEKVKLNLENDRREGGELHQRIRKFGFVAANAAEELERQASAELNQRIMALGLAEALEQVAEERAAAEEDDAGGGGAAAAAGEDDFGGGGAAAPRFAPHPFLPELQLMEEERAARAAARRGPDTSVAEATAGETVRKFTRKYLTEVLRAPTCATGVPRASDDLDLQKAYNDSVQSLHNADVVHCGWCGRKRVEKGVKESRHYIKIDDGRLKRPPRVSPPPLPADLNLYDDSIDEREKKVGYIKKLVRAETNDIRVCSDCFSRIEKNEAASVMGLQFDFGAVPPELKRLNSAGRAVVAQAWPCSTIVRVDIRGGGKKEQQQKQQQQAQDAAGQDAPARGAQQQNISTQSFVGHTLMIGGNVSTDMIKNALASEEEICQRVQVQFAGSLRQFNHYLQCREPDNPLVINYDDIAAALLHLQRSSPYYKNSVNPQEMAALRDKCARAEKKMREEAEKLRVITEDEKGKTTLAGAVGDELARRGEDSSQEIFGERVRDTGEKQKQQQQQKQQQRQQQDAAAAGGQPRLSQDTFVMGGATLLQTTIGGNADSVAAAVLAIKKIVVGENEKKDTPPDVINEFARNGELFGKGFPVLLPTGCWIGKPNQGYPDEKLVAYMLQYYDGRFNDPSFLQVLNSQRVRHGMLRKGARVESSKARDAAEFIAQPHFKELVSDLQEAKSGRGRMTKELAEFEQKLTGYFEAPLQGIQFAPGDRSMVRPTMAAIRCVHGPMVLFITFAPNSTESSLGVRVTAYWSDGTVEILHPEEGFEEGDEMYHERLAASVASPIGQIIFFQAFRRNFFKLNFGYEITHDDKFRRVEEWQAQALMKNISAIISVKEPQKNGLPHEHIAIYRRDYCTPQVYEHLRNGRRSEIVEYISNSIITHMPSPLYVRRELQRINYEHPAAPALNARVGDNVRKKIEETMMKFGMHYDHPMSLCCKLSCYAYSEDFIKWFTCRLRFARPPVVEPGYYVFLKQQKQLKKGGYYIEWQDVIWINDLNVKDFIPCPHIACNCNIFEKEPEVAFDFLSKRIEDYGQYKRKNKKTGAEEDVILRRDVLLVESEAAVVATSCCNTNTQANTGSAGGLILENYIAGYEGKGSVQRSLVASGGVMLAALVKEAAKLNEAGRQEMQRRNFRDATTPAPAQAPKRRSPAPKKRQPSRRNEKN